MGIEENRQAVKDAEVNVRLNHIPQGLTRYISGRVEEQMASVMRQVWDAVILDPPRQGCPQAVLSTVFQKIAPARAVYVSCNPDMLGIELPFILSAGYQAERIEAVDMFPHTDHIETIVRLIRK
jgi:23S rRNA (uracil1939-C5)-methyltransferase